jgi:hypothetical protein
VNPSHCSFLKAVRPEWPNGASPFFFSLKAVLAASSFCPATPCSDYSPAVTSSAPFLGLFVPNNSTLQRHITLTLHIHSVLIHSHSGGRCFFVTSSYSVLFHFFCFGGSRPLHKVQFMSKFTMLSTSNFFRYRSCPPPRSSTTFLPCSCCLRPRSLMPVLHSRPFLLFRAIWLCLHSV